MNIGDTVRLKSGGPLMTITQKFTSDFRCSWFTNDQSKEADFPEAALRHAKFDEEGAP